MNSKVFKTIVSKMVDEVHNNAVDHGWHDEYKSQGDFIALMHTELSEAFEEYRNNKPMVYYEDKKPEGMAVELADCVLRIFDWAGFHSVDIASIILEKHRYNKTRPYKHGGKKL